MAVPDPELNPRQKPRGGMPVIVGLLSAIVASLILWALIFLAGSAAFEFFAGAVEAPRS